MYLKAKRSKVLLIVQALTNTVQILLWKTLKCFLAKWVNFCYFPITKTINRRCAPYYLAQTS